MSYFGKEFDRMFNAILVLSAIGIVALVIGGFWLVIWLINHVRFV